MAKVAIIGGGVAGTSAAMTLIKAGADVSLFEARARLGGHCLGVPVPLWDQSTIRIDTGVCDFNPAVSGGFCDLLDELGLSWHRVNPDISFMNKERAAIWFTRDGQPFFRHPPEDPKQFLEEINRFNQTCLQTCPEMIEEDSYENWSAQRYLDAKAYGAEFRALYFDPRARADLSMPVTAPAQFQIRDLAASWRMLGIAGLDTGGRMAVQGGMHVYCDAAERWLRARKAALFLSTRVASISRLGDSVRLRVVDREKSNRIVEFDHVMIATEASQVVPLLEDASLEEARLFDALRARGIRVCVHQDENLLPVDRATWGAYNYTAAAREDDTAVTIYINRLQNLPASVPDVFVTINPLHPPDGDKIIAEHYFEHPVIGHDCEATLRGIDSLQGQRRTWFCGGYLRPPFVHGQAFGCGKDTAQRLMRAAADESLKFEAGVPAGRGGFDAFLRDIPMFADLDGQALTEVQLVARPFQADAGDVLFRQGDKADGFYLIKRGELDICRRIPGDETVRVAVRGAGTIVGEMSLLDGRERSAHAIASVPAFGYFISADGFQMLRSDCRPAAFAVMNCFRRELAARARSAISEVTGLVAAEGRVTKLQADAGKEKSLPSRSPGLEENILLALPFFRSFTVTELRDFTPHLQRQDFARGQIVYGADKTARTCLIIARGALALNFSTPKGFAPFSVLGPGHLAGELGLIDGGPQPLACIAREDTIAFSMDRISFDLLARGGSPVALKFFTAVTAAATAVLRRASAHLARTSSSAALREQSELQEAAGNMEAG